MSISEDLGRLEAILRELNREEVLRTLQPGVSAQEVSDRLAAEGLTPTGDLISYFGWHNGSGQSTASIGQLALFPGFYALTLEGAISNYRAFLPDARWSPGWLPVFADGGGYFYVVDLSANGDGAVRMFRNDDTDQPIEHLSLAKMIETLLAAYERGIFFPDGEYIESNDDDYDELAGELNPGVAWWQDE